MVTVCACPMQPKPEDYIVSECIVLSCPLGRNGLIDGWNRVGEEEGRRESGDI